jgi:hypothetical protein
MGTLVSEPDGMEISICSATTRTLVGIMTEVSSMKW